MCQKWSPNLSGKGAPQLFSTFGSFYLLPSAKTYLRVRGQFLPYFPDSSGKILGHSGVILSRKCPLKEAGGVLERKEGLRRGLLVLSDHYSLW